MCGIRVIDNTPQTGRRVCMPAGIGLEVFAGPFVRSSYRAEEAFLKVVG